MVVPGNLGFCAATRFQAPVLDRLEAARANGFHWISLLGSDVASEGREGLSPAELGRRVTDAGLAVSDFEAVSTWLDHHRRPEPAGDRPGRPRDAERICPLAAGVGARSVSVVEPTAEGVPIEVAAEGFARVCDVAADHGLVAALEFLPWTGVPSLTSALEIVAAAGRPNGTVLVDTWHFFRSGSTLEQLAAAPRAAVGSVQINDAPARAEPDLLDETMHRRLVPGQGAFDLVGFLRTLDGLGYDGPVGVEVLSDELSALPVDVVARRCSEGIRSVLRAAGEAGS